MSTNPSHPGSGQYRPSLVAPPDTASPSGASARSTVSEKIIGEMLRVGRQVIVTFPNFGYWGHRLQVLRGHMPVSPTLPYEWYNTPNVHLFTIGDFEDFCAKQGIRILERVVMDHGRTVSVLPSLMGSLAVYRFDRGPQP